MMTTSAVTLHRPVAVVRMIKGDAGVEQPHPQWWRIGGLYEVSAPVMKQIDEALAIPLQWPRE